jgi:type IV pilus assembly protein PilF
MTALRTASTSPPARPFRVAAAPMFVAAASLIAACTTVGERPQPVRDLRSGPSEPRRDPALEPRRADPLAGTAQPESEQRRREQIRLELGAGHDQQGNYARALEELRAALTADPDYAQAYGLLGLVHVDLKDRDRAEASFQRALSLAPTDSELLNNHGCFLRQTGRPREAIARFETVLRDPLYPTPARPLHNASICAPRIGDEPAGQAYLQRSFPAEPRNPVAMYQPGSLYLKRGDLDRDRFHSRRLLAEFPDSAETLRLGIRIERQAGDGDASARLSAQLRRQFPASNEASQLQRGAFGD